MIAIIDFPTELLLEVASHLDHPECAAQACLALTCRRFYMILMQEVVEYQAQQFDLLLKRSIITPFLYADSQLHSQKADEDAPEQKFCDRPFSELRIRVIHLNAMDVRSVRYIICQSKHLHSVDILVPQVCDLRHLAAIMGTCFGKAGLHLRITGSFSEDESPFSFRFQSNGQPIQTTTHLADITSAVTKQGKQRDFWYFIRRLLGLFPATTSSSVPIHRESSVARIPSTISITVTQRKPKFHISSLPSPKLASLDIDGPIALLQSLYPVTLNALNSPIKSLTLQRISFTIFDWTQILPAITLPVLKDLTIGDLSIAFPDLLAFLMRHESIESISMANNNVIGIAKMPSHPILPRLKTLATNSEYLLPFLQYKRLGHLPALSHLRISSFKSASGPSMAQYPHPYDDLYPVYDLLSNYPMQNSAICESLSTL